MKIIFSRSVFALLFLATLVFANTEYTFTYQEGGDNGDSCGNIEMGSFYNNRATLFTKSGGVYRVKDVNFTASYMDNNELSYKLHKGSSLNNNKKIPSDVFIGTDEIKTGVSGGTLGDISSNVYVTHTYTQTDHIMDFNVESEYWISVTKTPTSTGNFCYGNSTGDAFAQDIDSWIGYGALYTDLTVELVSPTLTELNASATADGATVTVTADKNATLYYLLKTSSDTAPATPADVESGADGQLTLTQSSQASFDLTSYSSNTEYTLYTVAKSTVGEYLSSIQSITFTTDSPAVIPTLTLQSGTLATNSATVSTSSDVDATLYYIVVEANASTPTTEQIVAGQADYNGTVTLYGSNTIITTASTQNLITISGLDAETSYKIYLAAKSSTDDYSTKSLEFTTNPVPAIIPTLTLETLTLTPSGATISITSDVNATINYIVVETNATVPTTEQVIAGDSNYSGEVEVFAADTLDVNGSTANSVNLTTLEAETSYKIYVVAKSSTDDYTLESSEFNTTKEPVVHSIDINGTITNATYDESIDVNVTQLDGGIASQYETNETLSTIVSTDDGNSSHSITVIESNTTTSFQSEIAGLNSHIDQDGNITSTIENGELTYKVIAKTDGTTYYEVKKGDDLISSLTLPFTGGITTLKANGEFESLFTFDSYNGFTLDMNTLTFTIVNETINLNASLSNGTVSKTILFEVADVQISMEQFTLDMLHPTTKGDIKITTDVVSNIGVSKVYLNDSKLFNAESSSNLLIKLGDDDLEQIIETIEIGTKGSTNE